MSDVVIQEDNNVVVIAEDTIPNSIIVDDAGTTSVVSVTSEGDSVVVTSESAPALLMITTGGSAYVSAVNKGFVGSEVDWLYELTDSRASVTYVNDIWAQLNNDIAAQNTQLRQVIADEDFALSQTITGLNAEFNSTQARVDTIESAFASDKLANAQKFTELSAEIDSDISALNTSLQQVIATETSALSQNIDTLEASVASDINAVNNTLTQAYADLDGAVSTRITNMETEFNGKYATITSVDKSISNAELAMASQRDILEARINNNIGSKVTTLNQAIADESSTRANALISVQSQINSKTQANANLILETNSNVDGLSSALAGLRTAVSGVDSQSQAELALESLVSDTQTALSRAHLTVTNTLNGISTVSGLSIGGSENGIEFRGDVLRLSNTNGDPKLYWDTVNNNLVVNAKLVLGDGHTINNYDDIRAEDGIQYYIRPTNGTAIKNDTGSLTVESRRSKGGTDGLFGYLRRAGVSENLGTSYTFSAAQITNTLTVEMVVSGTVVDTITLADITDGSSGSDGESAIIPFIESERITWTQAKNNGAWPADGSNNISARFYKDGSQIAYFHGTVVLNKTNGTVSFNQSNYSGASVSITGSGTSDITLKFTHTASNISVFETFSAVSSGDKGDQGNTGPAGPSGQDGSDGIDGANGAGFYGGNWTSISWTASTATSRFTSVAGRAPVSGDVLIQTDSSGASQARKYDNGSWVSPGILVNGDIIATGSIAGDKLTAGTEISGPVVTGGLIRTNLYPSLRTELDDNPTFPFWIGSGSKTYANAKMYCTSGGSLYARDLTILGNGSFSGSLSGANGTFTGSLSGADGTFSGELSGGSLQIGETGIRDDGLVVIGDYDGSGATSRLILDSRPGEPYALWFGNYSYSSGSSTFWIKKDGTGYMAKGFISDPLSYTGSGNGTTSASTTHISEGNPVTINFSVSIGGMASGNREGDSFSISYRVKRNGTTIDSGTFYGVGGIYEPDPSIDGTMVRVFGSSTVVDDYGVGQTRTYTVELVSYPPLTGIGGTGSSVKSSRISTFESY